MIDWVSIVRESTHRRFSHMGMYFTGPGRIGGGGGGGRNRHPHHHHHRHPAQQKPHQQFQPTPAVIPEGSEEGEVIEDVLEDYYQQDRSAEDEDLPASETARCTCCFLRVRIQHQGSILPCFFFF